MICANDRQESILLPRDPDGVGGAKEEVGVDAEKEIDDELVLAPGVDTVVSATPVAVSADGVADEEIDSVEDGSWDGGCN